MTSLKDLKKCLMKNLFGFLYTIVERAKGTNKGPAIEEGPLPKSWPCSAGVGPTNSLPSHLLPVPPIG